MIDLKQITTELGPDEARLDTRNKALRQPTTMNHTRKSELTYSPTGRLEGLMHRVIITERNLHCWPTCHPGNLTWQNFFPAKMLILAGKLRNIS